MSSASQLADAIGSTRELFMRFFEGFDDANATAQAPGLPNHAAWTLGHLALTMHRAAEQIAGVDHALAWDPEPYAFGSKPSAAREAYPLLAELLENFHRAFDLLLDAIRGAGDDGLARTVTWGANPVAARDLALRMAFHNGTHCGQLVDLRRVLRMGPVIA
jgi:hypothetical protein